MKYIVSVSLHCTRTLLIEAEHASVAARKADAMDLDDFSDVVADFIVDRRFKARARLDE